MSKISKSGGAPPRFHQSDGTSPDYVLSPSEQDREQRVFTRALAVLEDAAAARAWIKRSNRSLGGDAPLALLATDVGYELVLDTLSRIEYGIIS